VPILDSTTRFSSRVGNYVRYRPGYPPEVLQTLQTECPLTSRSAIADVGSGTGFLAKLFLENGNQVYGVEPNKEMREAGENLLRDFPNFVSVAATAETTTLPRHSVDFITAGQAAHWFDTKKARMEFARILKPGGWVVLVWNDRETDTTPLLAEYESLLEAYCPEYAEVRTKGLAASKVEPFFSPAQMRVGKFPSRQVFDYQGLEGRLLSSSYSPPADDPKHQPMLQELRRIFDRYQVGGKVMFDYDTRMYYGQVG
jgi:SAM-dependent methyltransferase